MANRKIKITYTKQSGRPPLITTESNLENQQRYFHSIIKDVELVDEEYNPIGKTTIPKLKPGSTFGVGKITTGTTFINPPVFDEEAEVIEEVKVLAKHITLDDMYLFLQEKGKTKEEIDEFLYPKIKKTSKTTKTKKNINI